MRKIVDALAFSTLIVVGALWSTAAFSQQGTPFLPPDNSSERIFVAVGSGNAAASTATAVLSVMNGKTSYVCGFAITSSGATSAAVVTATLTNVIGGTWNFIYPTVAGVTTANPSLVVNFAPACVASNGSPPTVTLPSLGAGNTNASVQIWGYAWGQ